jgi:hypothetical protein
MIHFVTFILAAGLVLALAAWGWIAFERVRAERERRLEAQARRRLVERESEVMVIKANWDEQVFIRDQNKDASWRPPGPAPHANGQSTQPNPLNWTSGLLAA